MEMVYATLVAFAPGFLIHVAWLVIAIIGLRRHGGAAFALLIASASIALLGSGVGVAQFVVMRSHGIATIQYFAIASGLLGSTAGVLGTIGLALLVARPRTRAAS